jgi:serine/threonine-protein kinase RsbW
MSEFKRAVSHLSYPGLTESRMAATIVLPGNFESLDKVCRFVDQIARSDGFDEESLFAIETAVDEAFSNIIDHAYGGENKGTVECSCEVKDKALIVTLHDYGRPFDPNAIPLPSLNSSLEDRKERGLGLYFMRKFMDEVHFKFSRQDGNTLVMIKRKEKIG